MLIWMREGTGAGVIKIFLLSILLLAAAGLVLSDVGGFFRGDMTSNTIVKGGGVNITAQEFDRTVSRVLQSQGMNKQEAYKLGLINNILQGEIQNRLFTDKARDLGLQIGDEDVAAQISKIVASLNTEGRSKKEALQQTLRNQGISEGEFVTAIRQEMANGLLRSAISAPPTLASPLLAQNLYRYDNEKRAAKIIVLQNDGITGVTQPTPENLDKYYNANKANYLIPETRTITLATLKSDMVKKNLKITEEKLKSEYDANIASFTKPAHRVVEQAVLKTEEEAKKAFDSVKGGKSLKDSTDSASYMGEQEYQETGLLPEVAKPVFSAKESDVLGPIQTSLGWHVLVVKKIAAESVTPFASVKDKLKTELEQIGATDEMFKLGNTIEDRIAGGDKLEDLVSEYGLTTEIIGPFRRNGMTKENKDLFSSYSTDREKLIQAAYDYDEGEVANIVETADGQFHLVRVDQVTPDAYKPYESVKAELTKRWVNEQQVLANKAKATALLESLNAGKSIDDVARENGASIRTIDNVNRKDAPPAPLTPLVSAQIFTTDLGKNFSSEIADGFVVGQVTNISIPPAANPNSKELKDTEDLVGRTLSQDILAQYTTSLTKGKKIQINQSRLQQLYQSESQ